MLTCCQNCKTHKMSHNIFVTTPWFDSHLSVEVWRFVNLSPCTSPETRANLGDTIGILSFAPSLLVLLFSWEEGGRKAGEEGGTRGRRKEEEGEEEEAEEDEEEEAGEEEGTREELSPVSLRQSVEETPLNQHSEPAVSQYLLLFLAKQVHDCTQARAVVL